jgi:3',5'-cyclic AMP phosphodiesterase CpdA
MSENNQEGINRRSTLECLIWAGTGVLWTMVGGVPRSSSLLGTSEARAQAASGFTFLQISDSHIGFKGAANPDPMATLEEAIMKIDTLQDRPAFMIHTGDISHVSKPEQFDNADKVIAKAGLDAFYVPGEHDILDAGSGKAYLERYGKRVQAKGTGWYSFDQNGVHFVGLVNVENLKAGGMGKLGAEQLAWLADDLKGKSDSTPIVLSPMSRCGPLRRTGAGEPRTPSRSWASSSVSAR